ncbi:uncharacterized protein Z520_05933 [Fonsecaea multimorphosa CBS 102226]|uniref:Uncharacterized protein n=1 Tax=Fonsecaea multimorphosa CBS 102226 TaxID=1442371 RepID=A0A0D2JYL1_9EURO|nr:uncharacterized protein Z520_05933 [Fonsecaea multimorphosa CBS 102226]KIX98632.1 hypothetical protein Z520_05933 [Fonsecaea multimorphosa CBS 102226]OAL24821.1 hypothetical protein AYO22_05610 [Fonsecaea multimorphosa]
MAAKRSVSVLGLGDMGAALARVLVENGWKTTVWNRTPAKAQPLVTAGATAAPSANECVRGSELVIACLASPKALYEVLESVRQESAFGRIFVDYTSGTPSEIEQSLHLTLSLSFSAYIRGAIITTPAFVGFPESVFYYSGDERTYRSIESDLVVLGTPIYLGANVNASTLQEVMMGGCFYGLSTGFLHTMATLKASKLYTPGAAQRLMAELIVPLLTQEMPRVFSDLARQIDEKDYVSKGAGVRLDQLIKAVEGMIRTSTELGLSSIVLGPMQKLLEVRLAQGGAAEEMSSLVEVIADPATIK